MEITTGLGMMLGPLIGTILYMAGGYSFPFYIFGSIFILSIPILISMMPDDYHIN